MWGYLSEFWDSIVQVGDTTVAWFQSVGNAVAGAVGSLFETTLHYLNDTWVFLGWIFSAIGQLITLFLLPLNFVFQFLKGLIVSAFSSPTDYQYSWSSASMQLFEKIPLWNTIAPVLIACVFVIALFFVLRLMTKL
jgi:hypothetical protein